MRLFILLVFICVILACKTDNNKFASSETKDSSSQSPYEKAVAHPMTEFKGTTVDSRFIPPKGYKRPSVGENTFANYLRKLPLKTPGSKVKHFNGKIKPNEVHEAVVDLKIGDKDLHQCADAIIRLKAEHHWLQKQYSKIHFNFTNGYNVEFNKWRNGKRMIVDGNKTYWGKKNHPTTDDYNSFWEYMELIFTYAGTASLSVELQRTNIQDLAIGDIFIKGGHPGHAVIVVDLAENKKGNNVFLLAQSFMPAQDLHILRSNNEQISPWYTIPTGRELVTPEWTFSVKDLKRFKD